MLGQRHLNLNLAVIIKTLSSLKQITNNNLTKQCGHLLFNTYMGAVN